jgi:flagellar FliL protein
MPEGQETIGDSTRKEEKAEGKAPVRFGKVGKIFLLTGIVLIQAAVAYAIVNHYYPQIVSLTSSFQSNNSAYYKFKNIVINPLGSEGKRYLMFSLAVKLSDEGALNTLKGKEAEAKDRVNILMSHYTAGELSSLKKRISIKKKLETVIDKIIGKKAVRNLFFTKYIMQ